MQSINTSLVISGLANGSPSNTQQPTLNFANLPFSLWGELSSPRSVTGSVVGIVEPQQYQVMVLAIDIDQFGNHTLYGDPSWIGSVAADGTFSVPLDQAAQLYAAVLATPGFLQSFVSTHLTNGKSQVPSLPTPSSDPGDVVLSLTIPAGLNRSIAPWRGNPVPELAPGQGWSGAFGAAQRTLQPPSSHDPAVNPTQSQNARQVWQQMLSMADEFVLSYPVFSVLPDGSAGTGAFAAGVYLYGSSMYLVAGAGPVDLGEGSPEPIITATQIVDWNIFVPSEVQIGMSITVLPEKVVFAADVLNVEVSTLQEFFLVFEKVSFEILCLLMGALAP